MLLEARQSELIFGLQMCCDAEEVAALSVNSNSESWVWG